MKGTCRIGREERECLLYRARFDYVNHARRLAFNELDDSDDAPLSEPETMDTSGSARVRKRTNPYENQVRILTHCITPYLR